jgi:CubicO group peptidase (beta-lactamase class C family)
MTGAGSMPPAHRQADQAYAETAAALVKNYVQSDLFSGSVMVAREGRPLLRKSFGLANREWNIPNAPETKFRVGSVTKQFTATAILQLVEAGKLKLDDLISRYYASAPVAWQSVTLHHLLTHTSGIPSYTALPDFPTKLSKVDHTPQEIIALTQDQPLEFEPGAQFAYDNTGYILLGYVVENASGQTYSQYLAEHVFEPLGMRDTGYDDSATVLPRRASGYRVGDYWSNAPYLAMSLPFAAGGLYSTIDDLLIWEQALSSGKVLDPRSVQAMFTDYGHQYGFGWGVRKQLERRLETHGGGINGFRSTLDRYPDDKLTVIILANIETTPVEKIARELAELAFGRYVPPGHEATIDPVLLKGYVGHYRLGPRFVLNVSREGDRLFVRATKQTKIELFPESDCVFFSKVLSARLTFEVDPQGYAIGVVLHQNGVDRPGARISEADARQIEAQPRKEHTQVTVEPALFDRYVGRYELLPNFFLHISREGDRLFSQATGQPKAEIFPEGDRVFFFKVVDAQITFETDDQGRAVRLILHQGGLDTSAARLERIDPRIL